MDYLEGWTSCRRPRNGNPALSRCLLFWFLLVLFLGWVSSPISATITYSTEGLQNPSLYQSVTFSILSNPLAQDPPITTSDEFYLISTEDVQDGACSFSGGAYTAFSITSVSAGGYTGTALVPITPEIVTVGSRYVICFHSASIETNTVVYRGFTSSSATNSSMFIYPALYDQYTLSPTTSMPTAGAGPVGITIPQVVTGEAAGRPLNLALTGSQTVLLVSCPTAVECTAGPSASLVENCATQGAYFSNNPSSNSANVIPLSNLKGQGTNTLFGTFVVPYVPNSAGYTVCIPYCVSLSCTEPSFALLATTSPSAFLLTFGSPNPSMYSRNPSAPQARELGTITITGEDLSVENDRVTILIANAMDCSTASSSGELLPNMVLGNLEQGTASKSISVSFEFEALISTPVTGLVCYYLASTQLWTPVYLNSTNPVGDFTIDVLQPQSFTVFPSTPVLGSTIEVTFMGNGLSSEEDLAFLTAATSSNPCTTNSSEDGNAPTFPCEMTAETGGSTTTPVCTALVNTDADEALQLSVCYQKGGTSNYALLGGTISIAARAPVYNLSSSPIYAGAAVTIQFSGAIETTDVVKLTESNAQCGTASTVESVSILATGTLGQYMVIGEASSCVQVCYFVSASSIWVISGPTEADRLSENSLCDSNNLYIAPFPLRYTINVDNANTNGGVGLTVNEVATVTLTVDSSTSQLLTEESISTLESWVLSEAKVVQALDTCVTTFCNNVAACTTEQSTQDYVSEPYGASQLNFNLLVHSSGANYVLCTEIKGMTGVFIPVLSSSANSPNATSFSFSAGLQNPVLGQLNPFIWRAWMSTYMALFNGNNLNSSNDNVYVFGRNSIPYESAEVVACPTPQTISPYTPLLSSSLAASESSTTTNATFSNGANLYNGQLLFLCYLWTSGSIQHMTFVGSVTMASPSPNVYVWESKPASGYLAGYPVSLLLSSNTTTLSESSDTVYFYRFLMQSTASTCFCSSSTCSSGTILNYLTSEANVTELTQVNASAVQFTRSVGFDNYGYAAYYVTCYARTGATLADTYLGVLSVGMGDPTFYTLSMVDGSSTARVGALLQITAVNRCRASNCPALTTADSLVLAPSTMSCALLENSGSVSSYSNNVGDPIVSEGLTFRQRIVPLQAGNYRVCFRRSSESDPSEKYSELPAQVSINSNSFQRQLIPVEQANPSEFASFPIAPSAGELLTISMVCSTSQCSSCQTLRIVPGALANCWDTVPNSYSSSSCLNTTSYLFPEVYLSSGSYTLCFGSALISSSRIPGTLEVADSNPSSFAPAEGNGTSILVDQSTNYVVDITGSSLSQGDTGFFITAKGLTCHQLRNTDAVTSGVLGEWLLPSVSPYPLVGSGSTVQWLVSNREKRFGAGLLLNTTYCPGNNKNCEITLCYQRAGRSWAPVLSISNEQIDVVASNPSSAEFDQYPLVVNMYTMVAVRGTGLQETDALVIYSSRCESGTPVSTSISGLSPVVSGNGTTWQGVIRLTGTAETYAVCYTRTDNKQVVEIVMLNFTSKDTTPPTSSNSIFILPSPLYYLLSRDNFTESDESNTSTKVNLPTIFEELQVRGTFVIGGGVTQPLTGGALIRIQDECNYPPFSETTSSTQELPIINTLELLQGTTAGTSTAVYQARLYLPNNNSVEYALCLVLTSNRYFRVTESATPFSAGEGNSDALVFDMASPFAYQFTPPFPSIGQQVQFTFSSLPTSTTTSAPMLEVGDIVEVIDGSLFECGFHNSTLQAGAGLTTSSSTNTNSTVANASITLAFVDSLESMLLTICYRKVSWGGTFATVPLGTLEDKNFQVLPLNPVNWAISPRQAILLQPLSITFYPLRNSPLPSFSLTSSDIAFLVEIIPGNVTTAEERNKLCQDGSPALSSDGQSLVMDTTAGTSRWDIPSMPSEIEMYVVCYRPQQNSMAISYVENPAILQLYPPESPTGVYTNRNAINVFQGERFYLFFNTTESLNVALESEISSGNNSAPSKDIVRFSTAVNCSTAVSESFFQTIPGNFGFKVIEEYNSDGILIPYLNLRVRANAGKYYVCMKRANQDTNQYYYDFSVIGGVNTPAELEVYLSPLRNFSTAPTLPRSWVPDTSVSFVFNSTDVTVSSFAEMFFVPFSGSENDVGETESELLYDDCYRPTPSEADSLSTQVVSTTLQVNLSSLTAELPFPSPGLYLLCYQFKSANASDPFFYSSVYPTALTVLSSSPTSYVVPQEVSVGRSFVMGFSATDSIFLSTSKNKAQIFSGILPDIGDANNTPSCLGGTIPGGESTFTSFDAENTTYATVTPNLEEKGYYYVCFLTDGQLNMFPVPNINGGGYFFSVGVFGPQSYTVEPESPFLGATATLIISGSMLSTEDRMKVVAVADTSTSAGDLSQFCTSSAPNADSSNTDSSGVAVTPDASAMHAIYEPRLNSSGTFILCYQSNILGTSWYYVSPVESFTVQNAHPSSYVQDPFPSYASAINRLLIYDSSGLLTGVSDENLKLVSRTNSSTFDCTEAAVQSSLVGLLSYQKNQSSDVLASYAICASAEATLTVCFKLPVEGSGWAEVPFTSPPPVYDFRAAQLMSSPFQTAPVVVPSSPRPFATFTINISSAVSTVEATFISFAPAPQSLCTSDIPYVSPIYYVKSPTSVGSFQVALPKAGSYNVYVGSGTEWKEPNVTLSSVLVIGNCDPCSFTPPYAFINTTVSLKFPSATGSSLSSSDTMRLIPVKEEPTSSACSSSEGPFGSQTFSPVDVGTGESYTVFSVDTGPENSGDEFEGAYYACYRRLTDEEYAVVSDGNGTPILFSIFPNNESVITAVSCPLSGEIYSLETVTYNLTSANPELYPMMQFGPSDQLVLVRTAALTEEGCSNISSDSFISFLSTAPEDTVIPTLESFTTAQSNWYATFPLSNATVYTLCFRLGYTNTFFELSETPEEVLGANPSTYSLIPPVVLPTTTTFLLTINGADLKSTDEVYLVSAAEGKCIQTCYFSPILSNWNGIAIDSVSVTSEAAFLTVSNLLPSGSSQGSVMLRICYRRTNAFLTELGEIFIGEQNPTNYSVSFVPRVRTRPMLTFTGKNLTDKDEIFLVSENQYCLPGNSLASGLFLNIDTSPGVDAPTWTSFYLPLSVKEGSYTVCYVLSTIGAGVAVGDPLDVLPGGPSEFSASNTPMIGRTTTITFPNTTSSPYEEQVGDTAFITCPGCSCYDEILASVAYGVPSGTSTSGANISIRVGFSEQLTYLVCYKVNGSGYALVSSLIPLPNSPSSSSVYPEPTYQGQRLYYTFLNFTSYFPVSQDDSVMLVQFSRECWVPAEAGDSSIVVSPSLITNVAETGSAVWNAHIPSVGPDTPSSTLFPLNYTLCYREAGQPEFVAVPFPYNTSRLVQPPDPSVYATSPAVVRTGMIGIEVAFSTAEEGDEAYLVAYNESSNTDCTDLTAQIISDRGSAYPFYTMNVAGDAPVGSAAGVFCYIKKGATVAEVPQLLSISEGNPSGYETNATNPEEITFRDYLAFNITGSGLAVDDVVVFSEKSCAEALGDSAQYNARLSGEAEGVNAGSFLTSSPLLSRLSDFSVSTDKTMLSFVAQFRNIENSSETVTVFLCYFRENVWVEVGAGVVLQPAEPQAAALYQVNPGSLPDVTLRAGQHIQIELTGFSSSWELQRAAVVSGNDTDPESWCSNFTDAGVQEKNLVVLSSGLLDVSVWLIPGSSRLCLLPIAAMPWRDAGETQYARLLAEVFPPNPSYMEVFPSVPRVGQQVTFTFYLVVEANEKDIVKIIEDIGPDTPSCFSATSLAGFDDRTLFVTVVNNVTTTLTPIDSTDPLGYRSFNTSTTVRICYYSATEEIWSVVGQLNTSLQSPLVNSNLVILPLLPQSWKLYSGSLVMGKSFQLSFMNNGSSNGNLNPDSDRVWAVPEQLNCSRYPESSDECPGCLSLPVNASLSSETEVVTEETGTTVVDSFHLCYRLNDSTPAVIPDEMVVVNASISCSITQEVIIGAQQTVIFEKEENVSVTDDTWRVSFYAAKSPIGCQDDYIPEFIPERATQSEVTATTVSYTLEWPVALTDEKYVICYRHENEVGPVCTCEQLTAKNGECYLQTVPASPSFVASPYPTYVGETITINFTLLSEYISYPPTAVKFVNNTNPLLTTCQDNEIFVPSNPELVKQTDMLYTYTFQYDYKIGPSELLVCAVTSRTDQYVRVPSVSQGNVLLVRPFMELTTFPSVAEYIRATQTILLNFTHQSNYTDDVVSLEDQIFVVTDPYQCTEGYINAQNPVDTMKLFDIYDTAFDTLPTHVSRDDPATKSSFSTVTFAKGEQGAYYWCYKLVNGTWAPVLPVLTVLSAPVENCVLQNTTGLDNGGDDSLRAMQYIATTLAGDSTFTSMASPGVDAVRVVPANQMCTDDSFSLFESTVVASNTAGTLTTVVFTTVAGEFKVCYRFGGEFSAVSNWSPVCSPFTVTAPTPTGETTGCFSVHQALDVTAAQRDNFVFSITDTFRFISGDQPCLSPSLTPAPPYSTIDVGGMPQTSAGVSPDSAGNTFSVPYALLRSGTTSFRLCYTDASGTQFAVPIQYATNSTASSWMVSVSQPSGNVVQQDVQVGQRFFMNFTSSGNDFLPLTPYGVLPDPFQNAPAFNNTFDGAGLLGLASGVAYRDGRCIAAAKSSPDAENPLDLLGVYGPTSRLYTETAFAPTIGGTYITCYRLASCLVVDVGKTLQVFPSNPGSTATVPPSPRRGQLIKVEFDRSTLNSTVIPLTPGKDRGIKAADLTSCWDLSPTAGTIVDGTTQSTYFTAFFPAQSPLQASITHTLACYFLTGGSWSSIPNGEQDILPANPSGFSTTPTTARADQLIELQFSGENFSSGDTVKILSGEVHNCSDDALPSDSIDVFDSANNIISKGGTSGDTQWTILSTSSNGTVSTFRFSSSSTGPFSVCYRLQTDVVWTLVYGTLSIASRNPSSVTMTPVAVLETELFTLQFSSVLLGNGRGTLQATDRVVLYEGGDVNCLNPGDAVSLSASPSDTGNLPDSIAFQLDCATRGEYTVCYLATVNTTTEASVALTRVPIWGFPSIMAQPDPVALTVFTMGLRTGDSVSLRAMEIISLVFKGFGLVAEPKENKTDTVKLISALSYPSPTDASCRDASFSSDVISLPLYANGTYSVQQIISLTSASSFSTSGTYWVCYRLNGGQYHLIGSKLTVSQDALPSGATSSKVGSTSSSGNTTVYLDGEAIPWTVDSNSVCESVQSNYLFYSADGCGNVPYYVDGINSSASEYFSLGYASVNCTSGSSTLVRIAEASIIQEAFPNVVHTSTTYYNLSLCYYYGSPISEISSLVSSFPSVTLLGEVGSISVAFGTPPPLSTPIMTTALSNFTITLSVDPTPNDYYALVEEPDACYGITAPSNAALFMIPTVEDGVLTIVTAVESAGTYYICYSHREDLCASDDRECARIVGEIEVSTPSPSSWSGSPSPAYTTDTYEVWMRFPSTMNQDVSNGSAWLAPTLQNSKNESITVADVYAVCSEPSNGKSAIISLAYDTASEVWKAVKPFSESGQYALCYRGTDSLIHFFAPVAYAGPMVSPSEVTSASWVSTPVLVQVPVVVILNGGGLSTADIIVAVKSGATVLTSSICSDSSSATQVPANPESEETEEGLSSLSRTFVFPEVGTYVLCYRSASLPAGSPLSYISSLGSFSVLSSSISVTVQGSIQYVGVPVVLLFSGAGLSDNDEAALTPTGNIPLESVTADICETPAAMYVALTNTSSSKDLKKATVVPAVAGSHVICFKNSTSTNPPFILPPAVTVYSITASFTLFTAQPVCSASRICEHQPAVQMRDSSGNPSTAFNAVISLSLISGSNVNVSQEAGLTGVDDYFLLENYTTFQYLAVAIRNPGSYRMMAKTTLPNNVVLVAFSDTFNVAESNSTQSLGKLTCSPLGILQNQTETITCTVTALVSSGPSQYDITVFPGSATNCEPVENSSSSFPSCQFVVTPSSTDVTNYIAIYATPAAPFNDTFVLGSPTFIRIPQIPDGSTRLSCVTPLYSPSLPSPDIVRAGDNLSCEVQGMRTINDVKENIVVLPERLRIRYYINSNGNSFTKVDIGAYPDDLNGLYAFPIEVGDSRTRSITVTGDVLPVSNAWSSMEGSPESFLVLGYPTSEASSLECLSVSSGSKTFFSPVHQMNCTLSIEDSEGPILGLSQDYRVSMPDGGTVIAQPSSATPAENFSFRLYAPPQPSSDIEETSYSFYFSVIVEFDPTNVQVVNKNYSLVFVRSILSPSVNFEANKNATLVFEGSGLVQNHRYRISSGTPQCSFGTPATASTSEGVLTLSFTVPPEASFIVCFEPADGTTYEPLLAKVFTVVNTPEKWTTVFIILVVIGGVLLILLLVLFIILLWRACCARNQRDRNQRKGVAYVRPPINTRYTQQEVYNNAESRHHPSALPPLPFPQNQGKKKHSKGNSKNQNVHDSVEKSDSPAERASKNASPLRSPTHKSATSPHRNRRRHRHKPHPSTASSSSHIDPMSPLLSMPSPSANEHCSSLIPSKKEEGVSGTHNLASHSELLSSKPFAKEQRNVTNAAWSPKEVEVPPLSGNTLLPLPVVSISPVEPKAILASLALPGVVPPPQVSSENTGNAPASSPPLLNPSSAERKSEAYNRSYSSSGQGLGHTAQPMVRSRGSTRANKT